MKSLFTILCVVILFSAQAQKPYFQQDVQYDIAVTLNDVTHTLSGVENLIYKNNSPDTLREMYIHLYFNAFNGSKTAFVRQLERNADNAFSFAKPNELGGYNQFSVKHGAQLLEVTLQKDNPDMAHVTFSEALLPNQSIDLTIAFEEKIPFAFSRPGHIDQQYLMSQWFPKPAVYDATGWHAQPYLENGEFYSEFGTFDVKITLPENYVVAATGELQTASERAFLQTRTNRKLEGIKYIPVNRDDAFPPSSSKTKTLQFTAQRVHDFAWFADKRFMIQQEILPKGAFSENDVVCEAYFTPRDYKNWQNGATYVRNTIEYYGARVGKFPYAHATSVAQYDRRGTGMEYPMITLIGGKDCSCSLEELITHEVGHNWFYGILGNNERDNGWLDEGLNTFYDQSYLLKNKLSKENKPVRYIDKKESLSQYYINRARANYGLYFDHQALAPRLSSDSFNAAQYSLAYYNRPALALSSLEGFVGRKKFDAAMQNYFSTLQFKHPQPNDFKAALQKSLGENTNLNWFFDGVIGTAQTTAYAIKNIKVAPTNFEVTVENKNGLAMPFSLSFLENDSLLYTQWYAPIENSSVVNFKNYNRTGLMLLDATDVLPQVDFKRTAYNVQEKNNALKVAPVNVSSYTNKTVAPQTSKYLIIPMVGYNTSDKFMAGLLFGNIADYKKLFEWSAIPLYSFNTQGVRGIADADYTFFKEKNRVVLGFDVRSFATSRGYSVFDSLTRTNSDVNANYFTRYGLKIRYDINYSIASNTQQSLQFRTLLIQTNNNYAFQNSAPGLDKYVFSGNSIVSELSFEQKNKTARSNSALRFGVDLIQSSGESSLTSNRYNGTFSQNLKSDAQTTTRLEAQYNYDYSYNANAKVYVRAYAAAAFGSNNVLTSPGKILSLTQRGENDYKFDNLFFARNESSGSFSNQIDDNTNGGMKIIAPAGQHNNVGVSDNFIASVNTKIDVPFKLPLNLRVQPYLDAGVFKPQNLIGGTNAPSSFLVSGGVALVVPNFCSFYFPLYYSGGSCADDPNGLNCIMSSTSFKEHIAINFNLVSFLPKNIRDNPAFK